MPGFKVSTSGPQWLMDQDGRVLGVRDNRGYDWHIPMMRQSPGNSAALLEPVEANRLAQAAVELCVGNSLGGPYMGWALGASPAQGYVETSHVAFANMLWPISYWPKKVTPYSATGTVDTYGHYGYAGQTLATILADLPNWFASLDTAGVRPDIVNLSGLFENDVGGAVLVDPSLTTQYFYALIAAIRGKWQGMRFKCSTPHPDTRVNTDQRKAAWKQLRALALGADDGTSFFTYDAAGPGSYADPFDPTQPLPGYTDGIVHPNAAGASLIGRIEAACNRRISPIVPSWLKPAKSADFIGVGATAQAGNGYNGTRWTALSFPSALGDGSANQCILTAGNPGTQRLVWTPQVAGNTLTAQINTATAPAALTTPVGMWMRARINSGAQNIRQVQGRLQITGTPTASDAVNQQSANTQQVYKDGDILTLMTPGVLQPTASATGFFNTLRVVAHTAGQPIDVELLSSSYVDLA